MEFDAGTFLLGGSIVGILASCWGYFRMLAWRLVNLMVVRISLQGGAGNALARHCWKTFKVSPFGERTYNSVYDFVVPEEKSLLVIYETLGKDFLVFWAGWRPLILFMTLPKQGDAEPVSVSALYLRGMFRADELLIAAADSVNSWFHSGDGAGKRFDVTHHFGHGGKSRS